MLEYRSEHFTSLRLGDRFEVQAERIRRQNKRIEHLMVNLEMGQYTFAAAAIAIGINLKTHRTSATPTEQQAHLKKFLLRP